MNRKVTRDVDQSAKRRNSMFISNPAIDRSTLGLHSLEHYLPLIGSAAVERISRKADRVRTMHVVHISSTFYGRRRYRDPDAADVDDECDGY
jgi:hypothetical protein